jgi:hypothetical protein
MNLLKTIAKSRSERRKLQSEIGKNLKPYMYGVFYKGDTADGIGLCVNEKDNVNMFHLFGQCLNRAELLYNDANNKFKNQNEMADLLLYYKECLLPESIEAWWKGLDYSSGKQPMYKSFTKALTPRDIKNLQVIFECVYFLEQEGILQTDDHNGILVMNVPLE